MKRTLLVMGGGALLAVFMFALSHTGSVPVAKADPGVPATVSWDLVMCDGAGPSNPQPHCADAANTTVGDDDGLIEPGENPEIHTNLWIDLTWDDPSDEALFDLVVTYWETGPPGPDQTGDGWEDPLSGVAANANPAGIGAAVGEITLKIQSNLVMPLLLFNNVDDTPTNTDATVMGQPPVCTPGGAADPQQPQERLYLTDTFESWSAATCFSMSVDHRDTDGDGCAQTQEDSTGGGADGDDCTLEGPPNGVVNTPKPLMRMIVSSGLPLDKYMARAFGIARLAIPPPPHPQITSKDLDVNLLLFNLLQPRRRYVVIIVVRYPGQPKPPPLPGHEPFQTVPPKCTPGWMSSVQLGLTVGPDYNEDGDNTDPHEVGRGGWVHRVAMNNAGPFDYGVDKSVEEDYDGDGMAEPYDRCDTDPTCGTAGDDPDGDYLCGTCDANGEGNGCSAGQPSSTIPWHPCQDVDGDDWINQNDNCPTVFNPTQEDRDTDQVGDVCDAAPDVPGDGSGYAGGFNDADNICVDQFSIGLSEPAAEVGAPPSTVVGSEGKYCMGPASEVGATQQPYVNPTMHAIGANIQDANDDGEPDYVNVAGVGLLYDANSDEDRDGHTDGCEGFSGTDALDASSVPGAPAVAGIPGLGGDCDNGGEWDYAEQANGRNPFNAADDSGTPHQGDSDADGCDDYEELAGAAAPKPGATGNYNPLAPYDFYDVPIPAVADPAPNGTRNQAVAMDDVLGVLFYVGTYDGDGGAPNANGVAYDIDKDGDTFKDGEDYDRAPSPAPNPPWDAGAPSGAVAMDDVLAVLAQTGLSCIGPP